MAGPLWQHRGPSVIDALQGRFRASPTVGAELTMAGENLTCAPPLLENASLLSKVLGFEIVTTQELWKTPPSAWRQQARAQEHSLRSGARGPLLLLWQRG